MAEPTGKVYLVGSGIGDEAFLTLHGKHLIEQAEVLIYDALADEALLYLASPDCLQINVGKRGGQPSMRQSEINRLLVNYCQAGKQVVRLKSGDPFIFGRAQSEMQALQDANCPYEVIPGISSALAAPLLAGIPLTDPVLSRGFAVVTAHDVAALDWRSLAGMDTLVLLMAGRNLRDIINRLREERKSPKTPIAIIRWAGRSEQQIWDGVLSNILAKTAGETLSPCVMVIGEVVRLRRYFRPDPLPLGRQLDNNPAASEPPDVEQLTIDLSAAPPPVPTPAPTPTPTLTPPTPSPTPIPASSFPVTSPSTTMPPDLPPLPTPPSPHQPPTHQPPTPPAPSAPASPPPIPIGPLTGTTILVTRAATQAGGFTDLLHQRGAKVIEMPTLEIVPPSSWQGLDAAIGQLSTFQWLILTSTNAVDYFFQRLAANQLDNHALQGIKIAVVGEKTAQRLQAFDLQPDFVPPNYVADSLISRFPEVLAGQRILFPRVETGGRDVLVREFAAQGAEVVEVAAYESRCPLQADPLALDALRRNQVQVVTFASSKTVQHFCDLLEMADLDWRTWLNDLCIASIGPQTSRACDALLGRVDVEAKEHTLPGLLQAIERWGQANRVNR